MQHWVCCYAGRRINPHLFVRYQQRFGQTEFYWAFVLNFNISNSIGLQFRAGRFPNPSTAASPERCGQFANAGLTQRNKSHTFDNSFLDKSREAENWLFKSRQTKTRNMITETINGVVYDFQHLNGIVVGKEKVSTQHLYGGGYYYQNGHYYPNPVSSVTTIKDTIFLEDEKGQHHQLSLTNWDIACLENHRMVFVWATPQGTNNGQYVAVKNISTNRTLRDTTELKNMSRYGLGLVAAIFVIPAVIFAYAKCNDGIGPAGKPNTIGMFAAIFFGGIGFVIAKKLNDILYKTSQYNKANQAINTVLNNFK